MPEHLTQTTLSVTTAVLNIYVHAQNGNDNNDGLTSNTPKLTIQAGIDLVPTLIEHNTYVHLYGTFTDEGTINVIGRHLGPGVIFVIGGDDDYTSLHSGTATGGSTSTVVKATLGATVDEYAGYYVRMTSGLASGERRQIFSNTATTLTVHRNWTGGAVANTDTFVIERPTTTLTSSASYSHFNIRGIYNPYGFFRLQNLLIQFPLLLLVEQVKLKVL